LYRRAGGNQLVGRNSLAGKPLKYIECCDLGHEFRRSRKAIRLVAEHGATFMAIRAYYGVPDDGLLVVAIEPVGHDQQVFSPASWAKPPLGYPIWSRAEICQSS